MLYPICEPVPDSVDNLFGYINGRGAVVVPPTYAGCSHYFEGKAAEIDKIGKSGFINLRGAISIPLRFYLVSRDFAKDYAR